MFHLLLVGLVTIGRIPNCQESHLLGGQNEISLKICMSCCDFVHFSNFRGMFWGVSFCLQLKKEAFCSAPSSLPTQKSPKMQHNPAQWCLGLDSPCSCPSGILIGWLPSIGAAALKWLGMVAWANSCSQQCTNSEGYRPKNLMSDRRISTWASCMLFSLSHWRIFLPMT